MEKTSSNMQYKSCGLCSKLEDKVTAPKQNGLPSGAEKLNIIVDLKPFDDKKVQIRQCPECRTYYIYRLIHESTADTQELTRLSESEIASYLNHMAEHSKIW